MGGDVTGKLLVPVVKQADGKYLAVYSGNKYYAENEDELEQVQKEIRFSGYYPYVTDVEHMKELQKDESTVNKLFVKVMLATLERWMGLAAERLQGTGTEVYMTGGNDDLPEVEEVIRKSTFIVDPEGKAVSISGGYEMISSGWSNPTPWKTPRECSEEDLWNKIDGMVSQVKDVNKCIFNLHVPPFDSTLDTCPKLDENLKPMIQGGEIEMGPGGSTSVRKAIEKYQPLVGLHGHIHEAKGFVKIGKTLCLNPGSEYGEGILRGALLDLDGPTIKNFLLTQG